MIRRKFCAFSFGAIVLAGVTVADHSYAAGTYRFCAHWQYQFDDQNLGEDYLKHSTTYGLKVAAFTFAVVQRNGASLWAGYLDTEGCSAALPAVAGSYTLLVTAKVQTPIGAIVVATPQQSSSSSRWFTATRQLAGLSSGSIDFYSPLGAGDTTAGAISIGIAMAQAADGRFVPGYTYSVYTELSNNEGFYANGAVWLGLMEYTNTWVSRLKTVVAHELGHAIQDRLFGFQYGPYDRNSTTQLCQCDHIDFPAMRSHCLQSREHIGAAQTEGFAHFHAAALFNHPLEANAAFAYYKEVRWQNGGPDQYPPVGVSAFYPSGTWHWMETYGCATGGTGTEIDWMNFLYEVHTKTANKFSMVDIARVFKDACGGSNCTPATTTTWTSLQNAVSARFGPSSARALYWAQIGNAHGVNW